MIRNKAEAYRRYLLDDLDAQEREQIECEFFADDDVFGALLGTEDELIDAYLQKRLAAEERELFERHFLAAENGRRKLAMATALAKAGDRSATPRRLPLALAAVLVLLAISGGLLRELVVTKRSLRQVESRQAAESRMITELRTKLAQQQPLKTVSFVLVPGLQRSAGEAARLLITHGSSSAELWLTLRADEFQQYTAILQSVDGGELWRERSLSSRALKGKRAVVFQVPVAYLQAGTFVVELRGIAADGSEQTVDDYSFTAAVP